MVRSASWLQHKIAFLLVMAGILLGPFVSPAQTPSSDPAWLRYATVRAHVSNRAPVPAHVRALGTGALEESAAQELALGIASITGALPDQSSGETVVGTVDEVRKEYP